jgi:hypothetical protein
MFPWRKYLASDPRLSLRNREWYGKIIEWYLAWLRRRETVSEARVEMAKIFLDERILERSPEGWQEEQWKEALAEWHGNRHVLGSLAG